ncbi:hypothetical protein JRO89_XS01G0195000 [Xanthoceras sorbifolium]|uniref:Retrotransposon Copia-like N-terminal domain-containing protein n=1 Tax=Xanthoceras sorbifolium TaxID=99658 RepID=A0ABQ8IKQ9_9ROSI|nr:hypothetical protein JRO89_XS01G0195000 [Xanthoceras sorbifolium]
MTSGDSRKKENESAKAMIEKVTDNMDSFTIHHSNHLSLVLVSKILEGENYGQWSHAMGLKDLAEREENERVMQFLMGLNESFATLRGSILIMSPLLDSRKVHALVLQQERQTDVVAQ